MTFEDKAATITRIALYWDDDVSIWRLLSVGEDEQEINERVKFWKGKGLVNIKTYKSDEI